MKRLKELLDKYNDDAEVIGIIIDKSLIDGSEFIYVNTVDNKNNIII